MEHRTMGTSLTDRLAQKIRAEILTGTIAPGTIVVEPRLADQYAVSKTPVREALRMLCSEGLLTVLPKKGYLVRTMGLNDVQETLDVRMLLEPHAAGAAATFRSPQIAAQLRQHLDTQREISVSAPLEAMAAAQEFHQLIGVASRNTRIVQILDACLTETARAHHVLPGLAHYVGAPTELAEHEEIYAAIIAGDAPRAEAAMAKHLRSIRTTMAKQFTDPSGLWG